jgi:hypothetical protein
MYKSGAEHSHPFFNFLLDKLNIVGWKKSEVALAPSLPPFLINLNATARETKLSGT